MVPVFRFAGMGSGIPIFGIWNLASALKFTPSGQETKIFKYNPQREIRVHSRYDVGVLSQPSEIVCTTNESSLYRQWKFPVQTMEVLCTGNN